MPMASSARLPGIGISVRKPCWLRMSIMLFPWNWPGTDYAPSRWAAGNWIPFLPVNADVIDGDLLISSGLGGTFPPGYPVGVIRNIKEVTGQPFLQVVAEPAAALNRIREVLLITPQGGDEFADPASTMNTAGLNEAAPAVAAENDAPQDAPPTAEATP